MEHESDGDTNCDWWFWYSQQRITKVTGGLRCTRTIGDHPNYYIIENDRNTEKSPAKTDMKNSQGVNNNNNNNNKNCGT